jgi:hypothetical protein
MLLIWALNAQDAEIKELIMECKHNLEAENKNVTQNFVGETSLKLA